MSYPNDKLWSIFQDLKYLKDDVEISIPVYMGEKRLSDNPDTYVVIQEQLYDAPTQFGDGQVMLRNADFNIYVNSISKDELNTAKLLVIEKFKENNLNYEITSNIYDPTSEFYTVTFEGSFDYVD